MPTSILERLEDLGVPTEPFHDLRGVSELSSNAEPALATLLALTSRQRVRTLLVSHPQLLCVPLGVWLDFLTAYGMSRQDFFSLLGSSPELFTRGSLFNAGSVMAYLQSLGLSPRSVVASIIPRNADVLLRDVQRGLVPNVDFLRLGLGLGPEDVRDFLCRCPGVLSRDVAAELAPRLELLYAVGFDRGTACRLLFSDGSLLMGDLDSALTLRLSLLTADCGLSATQAQAVLRRCPEALSLSLPNLRRKWRFLSERMGCGREQLLEYPAFLSKNLLLLIGPRFAYATERLCLRLDRGPGLGLSGESNDAGAVGPISTDADSVTANGQNGVKRSTGFTSSHGGGGDRHGSSGSRRGGDGDSVIGSNGEGGDGCGGGGGAVARLSLAALFEGDDADFLRRVWGAAAAAASEGGWVGAGAGQHAPGGGGDGGAKLCLGAGRDACAGLEVRDGALLLADFMEFRSGWLEREGARWTGVRSVGMTGSW